METHEERVATVDELIAATSDPRISHILVRGHVTGAPTLRLLPGQALIGAEEHAAVTFASGNDGVQLSSDNRLQGMRLAASPDKRALFNDTGVTHLGGIELRDVTAIGQV